MTREEWLRKAVEMLDSELFEGDLDLVNHEFQITCGKCSGSKLTETIQPYDGEDVKLEDFFPTTITVSHTISDPMVRLSNLARECVFAFFNEKKVNKRVKKLLEKYYFEAPFNTCTPSNYLNDILKIINNKMVKEYGEFPGKTVIIYPKPKKEGKKNTLVGFCPDCGYQIKVTRKMYEKHGQAMPTCMCGSKMALDCEDENQEAAQG